jgi:hypothetical protein
MRVNEVARSFVNVAIPHCLGRYEEIKETLIGLSIITLPVFGNHLVTNLFYSGFDFNMKSRTFFTDATATATEVSAAP